MCRDHVRNKSESAFTLIRIHTLAPRPLYPVRPLLLLLLLPQQSPSISLITCELHIKRKRVQDLECQTIELCIVDVHLSTPLMVYADLVAI